MRKIIVLVLLLFLAAMVFAECGIVSLDANSIFVEEDTEISFSCSETKNISLSVMDSEENTVLSEIVACDVVEIQFEKPFVGASGVARVLLEDGCSKQVYFSASNKIRETMIPDGNIFLAIIVVLAVLFFILPKEKVSLK